MRAGELSELLGGELEGNPNIPVRKPVPLEQAGEGDTALLLSPDFERKINPRKVGVLIAGHRPEKIEAAALILVRDPRRAMIALLERYAPSEEIPPGISELARVGRGTSVGEGAAIMPFSYIGNEVSIGKNTTIYPFTYVGDRASIGDDCILYPGVYVGTGCVVGSRVIIHSGARIGADGFGFFKIEGKYVKIPQIGRVVIEDDCEIGANTTIDRATLGETRIGKGTKIDNLVQVGHNVTIGPHTVIAAQTGIAGSTAVGSGVIMGGQVGIADHLVIGDNVVITAKSGITQNIPSGKVYSGYFARERGSFLKSQMLFYKLPEIWERLKKLEEKLAGSENTEGEGQS
ncbi:MAG: UDP-3-O-(3-hydroxymyristoyl)glucosamine N-acyltransferase [Candidatus Hydrothermae bacterium]|nr:UDP-3-O-(3-hydroxymyristoyl)glucosamine N-acyltransferase [Candidatus Hydrothermae bacterium]